jgi:hypothetical protein
VDGRILYFNESAAIRSAHEISLHAGEGLAFAMAVRCGAAVSSHFFGDALQPCNPAARRLVGDSASGRKKWQTKKESHAIAAFLEFRACLPLVLSLLIA